MKNILINSIKAMLCIVIAISLAPVVPFFAGAADKTNSDRIIVSMGDSYSSGEGIDDFYDYDLPIEQRVKSEDWLAHRSKNSWPGRLELSGEVMANKKGSQWYFVAASGAETKDITEKQEKTYKKGNFEDTVWLPAQISIFNQLKKENKKADYVTLTLGGNDLGFADIVETAVLSPLFLNKGALADKLNFAWKKFYGKTRDDLRYCYKLISKSAGEQAAIIVAGYPKLLAEGSVVPALFKFDSTEVEMINDSVTRFNKELNNLVKSCQASGMNIWFVPVDTGEGSFEGHEAYSNSPYINEVYLTKKEQDIDEGIISAYSIHPNSSGAQVYANFVQNKIDELEENNELPVRTTSDERDIVLVLDVSGSMSGKPIEETKKAAENFIGTILKEDASIGIVAYDNSSSMLSDFSVDEHALKDIVGDTVAGGGTNIEAGLAEAREMLSKSNAKKKIIVLMSDGEPNQGKTGSELVSYANRIKAEGTYIYTLGFFESLGTGKSSAQELMEAIASDGCHYEVADADDLVFFFGDIADQINGQKYIYVRIACPVDVTVIHDGEILRSAGKTTTDRTNFGTITFEENKKSSGSGSDDRIKVLRLKEGANYDVQIKGNGSGKMNYTIGFMDDSGEYSDLREFNDIAISPKTKIDTVAGNSSLTVLKVDSDGDGKYDMTYKAKANSKGELVNYDYISYIVVGVIAFIVLLIAYFKIKSMIKKQKEKKKQKKAMKRKFCTHCGSEISGDKKFCTNCGNKIE